MSKAELDEFMELLNKNSNGFITIPAGSKLKLRDAIGGLKRRKDDLSLKNTKLQSALAESQAEVERLEKDKEAQLLGMMITVGNLEDKLTAKDKEIDRYRGALENGHKRLKEKYRSAENNLEHHADKCGGESFIKGYMNGLVDGIVQLDTNLVSIIQRLKGVK
jgi:chromosome segregation ATPase